MEPTTIYRTEPMATRALGAEIRHDHGRFVALLERVSGLQLDAFSSVDCEVRRLVESDEKKRKSVRIDVELQFGTQGAGNTRLVGIEAKLDHELTPTQVDEQLSALGKEGALFVLVPRKSLAPAWLEQRERVWRIDWEETIACFAEPRLRLEDINGEGRLLKTTAEAWLTALHLDERLEDWDVEVRRGGSGMPSVVFESKALPDGKCIRGQIQVVGRRMPDHEDAIRFEGFLGISVNGTDKTDFPYFRRAATPPAWIGHLERLHTSVLEGSHDIAQFSQRAPGRSKKDRGKWKAGLIERFMKKRSWLAKGYTDWSLGPKTVDHTKEQLPGLADLIVRVARGWESADRAA
ncbi:hypothetical protein QUG98_03255 [Curtobacterium sp. RHCJP20]|uniref:DUF4365 domain-containing protein n=1 Tax=Curtobacterium subtropicum TaxID=3055138 RepID=A0ABT7TD16_9MICO|nr:hypothetical protein [Curtobacterium subtropicum]MDM7887463.1 hypothetical protein [Curtobacterium subtropicum]